MYRSALVLFVALSSLPSLYQSLRSATRVDVVRAALPLLAQLSSNSRTYSIRGAVVNSITGEGIRGALVQVYSGRRRSLLTGPDGRFQFDSLLAGQTSFLLQKPGYFTQQQVTPGARQPMVTVGPDTPSVTLKLVPEGIIHGRIVGDGEPIESLQVHLLSERMESGRKVRSEQRALPTNEDGEFRFADLLPGRYFLFLGPGGGDPFSDNASGARAQGYGSIFYYSAADLASATPIEVTPGKREEINVALPLRPFYRVSGTVTGRPSGQGINLMIFNDAGQSVGRGFRVDPDSGAFQTQSLPPGSYVLRASSQDNKTRQSFSAFAPLQLSSDVSGLHLALAPDTNIPASIRIESSRHDSGASQAQSGVGVSDSFSNGSRQPNAKSPAAYISLALYDAMFSRMRHNSEPVKDDETGSLVVRNVPPGNYTVDINLMARYYVASARSGFTDLLREPLTVSPGGSVQPIEVVLRDDFASLEGKVSSEAQADSADVLAIPEEAPQRAQRQVTSQPVTIQPGGVYTFHQLAPGAYKVLALDRIDGFEYANPEILRKYSAKMRDVILYPNQKATLDLELARLEE